MSLKSADPVFDRWWWLYSLCRERLFADHTDTIARMFAPLLNAQEKPRLVEVGCGPGFYSRRLAARFPSIQATGIDTSERLLMHARSRASRACLENCSFLRADVENLSQHLQWADAAIASRFFLILTARDRVMSSVYETLRPGGVFFVAEPVSPLRTAMPLLTMRAFDRLAGRHAIHDGPVRCSVLSHHQFGELVNSQPWSSVKLWRDWRYQYAFCEKAS